MRCWCFWRRPPPWAAKATFDDLVAGVSEAYWARRPAPEKWSVGEVAEHRAIKQHTWPHPAEFFGDLSVYQWLHFVAAHNQRHNGQMEEVRDRLAGIVRKQPAGFSVEHRAAVEASAEEVYRALVEDVGQWWQSDHTFSGDASNLSIEARPGGCFCEALPNGGGVTHLSVIHANPGKLLRLAGGLGPLQGEAVSGLMSWSLESNDEGTSVTLTYSVSGLTTGGLEGWAAPVAGVLEAQLDGLVAHLGSRPDAAGSQ